MLLAKEAFSYTKRFYYPNIVPRVNIFFLQERGITFRLSPPHFFSLVCGFAEELFTTTTMVATMGVREYFLSNFWQSTPLREPVGVELVWTGFQGPEDLAASSVQLTRPCDQRKREKERDSTISPLELAFSNLRQKKGNFINNFHHEIKDNGFFWPFIIDNYEYVVWCEYGCRLL